MTDNENDPADGANHHRGAEASTERLETRLAAERPQPGRRRLPARREHEIIQYDHDGVRLIAGVGRFPNGDLAELFFHQAGKPGSHFERTAHDMAVVASIALQRGATVQEIQHSLCKLRDGSAAGPLGKLFELAGP